MRNIKLFKTKKEYESFVWNEVFKEQTITNHPFYRNLIQFVIDNKAPIFYYQSDPVEHDNFSNYYNWQLIRETYDTPIMQSMFFLHDLTHMLWRYPYDVRAVTPDEFTRIITDAEYGASDETEILSYYRIPKLRDKIFQDRKILFDILREKNIQQPPARSLFEIRKMIIEGDILDPLFFTNPEDKEVGNDLKKYRERNIHWSHTRYEQLRNLKMGHEYFYGCLAPANYERILAEYQPLKDEADYERITLQNFQLMFDTLGLPNPPQTFNECFEKVNELEGKVMLK